MVSKLKQRRLRRLKADVAWWREEAEYGNCRTIETSAGYAIINVSHKPHPGDTVLISYCGRTEFAIVRGKALITPGGEALEGEALDDTTVHGVVTHFLNRVDNQRPDPIPVM